MAEKDTQAIDIRKDNKAINAVQEMARMAGIVDVKGMAPFAVSMGGKPYIQKDGLSIKMQQYANKHNGIKTLLSIQISYAHEKPEDMQKFLNLPPQLLEKVLQERDYEMAAFTTPYGVALNKCVIVFGDGLKVSETAIASKENVKMSTIHAFLDVMSATRAYNRCIKKLTAGGFMDTNLIDDDYEYSEADFQDDEVPFREPEAGDLQDKGMDQGTQFENATTQRGEGQRSEMATYRQYNEQVQVDFPKSQSDESKQVIVDDGKHCCECGQESNLIAYTQKKYGRTLCQSCMQKQ